MINMIAIGDNVVDCYLDQNKYYPGGNAVNVAVGAKKNGAKKVSYIGVFATDNKAEHIKDSLDSEEISYERARTLEGISGQPRVNINKEGDRIFTGGPKDTVQHQVKIRLTNADYHFISGFDLCHTSCYSWMEDELPELSKKVEISYDFSDNKEKEYFEKVCPYIDYAFLSASELEDEKLELLIERLRKYNIKVIGITRGSKPAVFIHERKRYIQETKKVEVVDTMGAGDSFIAAFLVEFTHSKDMEKALEAASIAASETCKISGGFGYPKEL